MFLKKIKLFLILSVLITAPVFVGADVSGTSPGGSVTGQSPVGIENPLKAKDLTELLNNIINFLLTLAAPIAVIMMIYAGYLFITASDNEEKVKTARKTMLYVVIGIAILILSKGVVTLVSSFFPLK